MSADTHFPATKFVVPRLRSGVVDRAELVESLATDALAVPLTVLSAPAGYGKTTVASMLADLPCWVSIDADDNDPRRFLAALGMALAGLNADPPDLAGLAEVAIATLDADEGDENILRRTATAILNGVGALPSHIVLVLDEWETVTNVEVHAQLEFLVERAPSNLHIVVTTRHDAPFGLARLRARDAVAERGHRDLRFTEAEADALLNTSLGLALPADEVTRVHRRTEGWPAGLRLLATSWKNAATEPWLPPSGDANVFAFLAEEVFGRQPADVQQFLLRTSVLSTLTTASCVVVTGRDDAGDVLDSLAQRGLFLTERGESAYRYHDLFADFLRRRVARLPEAERLALHRRGADAEDDPAAKIRHLLAAEQPSEAADMLESEGTSLLRQGRAASLRELLTGLPDAITRTRPRLLALVGDLAFAGGDLAAARDAFDHALRVQTGPEQAAIRARLADALYLHGDIEGSDALIDLALAGALDTPLRVRLLLTRAQVAQMQGRFDEAEHALADALDAAATGGWPALETAAAHLLPTSSLLRGGIDHIERFATTARRSLPGDARLPRLQVEAVTALVDGLRGRLGDAIDRVGRVFAAYDRFGGPPPFVAYILSATRVVAHLGESPVPTEEALVDLQRRAELMTKARFMYANHWFIIGRARWLRGEIARTREALDQMTVTEEPPAGSASLITVNRLSLEGLVAMTDGDDRRAEARLRDAVHEEDQLRLVNIYGSARLRLAHLYARNGHPDLAIQVAEPALAQCRQDRLAGRILFEGRAAVPVLRLFTERGRHASFATALLRQLEDASVPRPVKLPGTTETLTAREAEVLALLSAGATNREIAEQLTLGQETVKTHVARVFRKLGVRTRTAAAARARELALVPERR